ncbi:MAG: hypothetical protein JSR48_02260 [Verrucomicrobia bacterium]|nr:hypothetical protein [Verrucomicrobiota bacterium]
MTSPAETSPASDAPRVVVLPDALFFVRAVPVAGATTPAEAAAQAELALEGLSPFPPAQLYFSHFWAPGADRALVFAAYRRRFTPDQIESWADAELVLPAFATLLGETPAAATTFLVTSPDGLTAIHWDRGPVPAGVQFKAVAADADDPARAQARDELLRTLPGSRHVVELAAPPVPEPADSDAEFVFRAGSRVARLPAALAASLDVRDRGELATLRQARGRDLLLWRVFIGSLAASLLLALGWAGIYAAGFWEKARELKVAAQQPVIDQIMTSQNLATRVNELSSKRLLPLEMISFVSGTTRPPSIQFLRTTTAGLYTLEIQAQTTAPAEVSVFRSNLASQAACEKVEVRDQRTRDNVMSFTLVVTFKPGALKPASSS